MAVHTDQVLLSTGAWMDFSQHVHTLLLGGKVEEARTLWDSVFEVVHMGVDPSTPVLQSPDMPPIRRMPCCKTPCARCENRRGGRGSSSRSLGHGPTEPSSLKKRFRWHPIGTATMPILTRLWTLSQSKCMPLGIACKRPSSRIGWLVETMGFHRAILLCHGAFLAERVSSVG